MEVLITYRIQILIIAFTFLFVSFIVKKITSGRLREEYSIIWLIMSILVMIFSFWTNGLEIISKLVGVLSAPNLVFTVAIFFVFVYLIHLSVVNTRLHNTIKTLVQRQAITEKIIEKIDKNESN